MTSSADSRFPVGTTELAERVRAHPWHGTPLGPLDRWPEALRDIVNVLLEYHQPMFVAWGPERTLLYNDRFALLLGTQHPDALGHGFAAAWPDLHAALAPLLERASGGQLAHAETIAVYRRRFGARVRMLLTVSCVPVRLDDGRVAGVVGACEEVSQPHRATGAVRAAEARFRAAFDAAAIGMAQVDALGRFTEVNQRLCALLGFRSVELLGRTPVELTHPADRERDWVGLQELLRGHVQEHRIAKRMLRQDGAVVHVEAHVRAIRDDRGQVTSLLLMVQDVSARHDAESAHALELRAMTRLQELATRLTGAGDVAGTLEGVLDAAMELQGARGGTVQLLDPHDRSLRVVAHRGLGEPFLAHFGRIELATPHPCSAAVRRRARVVVEDTDGDATPGEPQRAAVRAAGFRAAHATPLLDRAGEPIGVLTTMFAEPHRPGELDVRLTDLLARQAADAIVNALGQERLAESEARFRVLVEGMAQAVWETDAEGVVVTDSPSWRAYTGQRLEEWLGFGWLDAIHPEDRAVAERLWRETVATERLLHTELRLRRAEGGWCWTDVIAAPLRGPDGRVRKWVGMNIDVSARRSAEEALRQGDRRKDEFLATLAHELRNPLAPIRNGLELLRLAEGNADLVARTRVMMGRQVETLVRLVDDLLELSRIARGKVELRREHVLLADVVRAAVEAAMPQVEAARHRLALRMPVEPVVVDGDAVRLAQVFANLLNNAAKFTPAGGEIALQAWRGPGEVTVVVRDTGIGIAPEMLPRVFDLFTQLGGGAPREQSGLGLGLTLVRQLVELHGGRVEARSEGEGKGSEFVVHLPLAADAPPAPEPQRPTAGALAVRRVLVVDDNHDAADSLALLMQMLGVTVKVAYDGRDAIEMVDDFAPDLVLLDLGMPGMSGYETARWMRERAGSRDAVLVALTGWGQERDRRRVLAASFDRHLVKPVGIETLRELLVAPRAVPRRQPAS